MNRIDSFFQLRSFDQARDTDLRRTDDININPRPGQRAKHPGSRSRISQHSRSDDRNLCYILFNKDSDRIQLIRNAVNDLLGLSQ